MKHYVDIVMKPDAEMRENLLMNMVYTKLHKVLFDHATSDIGVSFPCFQVKLGKVIRIHAFSKEISQFTTTTWLGGLTGYCSVTEIKQVPENVKYRTISRKQANLSNSKMRRLQKRGSLSTPQDIKNYKAKMFVSGLSNPYVELTSASTGKKHRRYFQFGDLQDQPTLGEFDFFGLSKTATIPWF